MSPRRRITALALALSLTVAVWLIASFDGNDHDRLEGGDAAPSVAGADSPRRVAAVETDAESGAGEPARGPEAFVRQPLWDPRYGDDLERARNRAEFLVRDARGQRIEAGFAIDAHLWRKEANGMAACIAAVDQAEQKVICAGPDSAGLARGRYELSVSAGPYGETRTTFTLEGDGELLRELELPNWRRIIRLRYVDQWGKPITYLPQIPVYRIYEVIRPADAVDVRARSVFDPAAPGDGFDPAAFTMALHGSHGLESMTSVFANSFMTDRGSYWVRVFAGYPTTIDQLLLETDFGVPSIELKSDFAGPEWDDYPIVLAVSDTAHETLAQRPCGNAFDPGNKSVRDSAPAAPSALDPRDLKTLDHYFTRLVVGVSAPLEMRLVSSAGLVRAVDPDVLGAEVAVDDAWAIDFYGRSDQERWAVSYRFVDDYLFESPPGKAIVESAAAGGVVSTTATVQAIPLTIEITPPSATVAAWATRVDCAVSTSLGDEPYERRFSIRRVPDGRFVAETGVARHIALALDRKAEMTVAFRSAGESLLTSMSLDESQRADLRHGHLVLAPASTGLALRAVAERRGLAFVEAVVIDADRDELSRRVHDFLERRAAADGLAPPADVAAHLKDEEHWYPRGPKLRSDSDGYVVTSRPLLTPGRRYVLYLWSRSRDPMQPDRRLEFLATEGITDLGAVPLPAPE